METLNTYAHELKKLKSHWENFSQWLFLYQNKNHTIYRMILSNTTQTPENKHSSRHAKEIEKVVLKVRR